MKALRFHGHSPHRRFSNLCSADLVSSCGDVVAPRMIVLNRGATGLQRKHLQLSLLGHEIVYRIAKSIVSPAFDVETHGRMEIGVRTIEPDSPSVCSAGMNQ